MKAKKERLETIRWLVESKDIGTHEEIVKELGKLGLEVTQATVSRDVVALGLKKVRRGGRNIYLLPETEEVRRMLKDFTKEVEYSRNLIVVKTLPGTAQGVASKLDSLSWPELVGTVAGDDTVLVVTKNDESGQKITEKLVKLKEEEVS